MHLNRSLYRGSHSYCSHSAAKFYSWESLQRAWRYSQLHFPPWNRLHPQVVCQSPEASYSDAAAVLNLMLCLAHPTRGHWKVRPGLHKIKREMRGREKKRNERESRDLSFKPAFPGGPSGLGRTAGSLLQGSCGLGNSERTPACFQETCDMPRGREEVISGSWDYFPLIDPRNTGTDNNRVVGLICTLYLYIPSYGLIIKWRWPDEI